MIDVEKKIIEDLCKVGSLKGSRFLSEILAAPSYQNYEPVELVLLALEHEIEARTNEKSTKCLRYAKLLSSCASLDAIEYTPGRNIDRKMVERLSSCKYIAEHSNICIVGSSGTGKTFLGKAFAVQACRAGIRTRVVSFLRIVRELTQLRGGKSSEAYEKRLRHYSNIPLLMIDDWLCEPLKPEQVASILELVDARYQTHSTIVCSQLTL